MKFIFCVGFLSISCLFVILLVFVVEYIVFLKYVFSYIVNKNLYVCEKVFGIGFNFKLFMFFFELDIDLEKEILFINF